MGSSSQKWGVHIELLQESNFKQPKDCNLCLWCPPGAPVLSLDGLYQAGPRTKCVLPSHHTLLKVCFSPAVPTYPYQTLSFQEPSSPANALISFPAPALSTRGVQPGSWFSSSLVPWLHMLVTKLLHPALKEGILSFLSKKLGSWRLSYSAADVECLGVFGKTVSPPSVPNNFELENVHDAEIFSNRDLLLIPDRKQYVNWKIPKNPQGQGPHQGILDQDTLLK